MSRIRLKLKSVTEIVGTDEVGLLILVDEDEKRQIAVTCNRVTLNQFQMRLAGRPLPSMLSETLWQVVSQMVDGSFDLVIYGLSEGHYKAVLYNDVTFDRFPIPASDAVLLSLISNVPLYIETKLMEIQSSPYDASATGMSIPVNTISNEMLNKALKKAVEDENYELASYLRDEQRRRSNESSKVDNNSR